MVANHYSTELLFAQCICMPIALHTQRISSRIMIYVTERLRLSEAAFTELTFDESDYRECACFVVKIKRVKLL